ncbi:MAG TPA: hypothetical protein VEP50_03555 [bacterium]|nr:hypothetical protein [bacterium]
MRGRTWIRGATAAIAAACLFAVPALADVTIKGDQAAANEAMAAFKKLYSLPGFRMKVTTPDRGESIMEFAAGNYHMTGHLQNGSMEIIKVGDTIATKIDMPGAPAGWRCRSNASTNAQVPADPTTATQGTIEVSRGPDTTIEGTPVHTIIYTRSEGAGGKDTMYVGSQTGLPRRLVSESGGHSTTVDYYDYGAPISITLPQCAAQ